MNCRTPVRGAMESAKKRRICSRKVGLCQENSVQEKIQIACHSRKIYLRYFSSLHDVNNRSHVWFKITKGGADPESRSIDLWPVRRNYEDVDWRVAIVWQWRPTSGHNGHYDAEERVERCLDLKICGIKEHEKRINYINDIYNTQESTDRYILNICDRRMI